MDDFDDEMTGVPFAPTAEEQDALDPSAEVARLRGALRRALPVLEAAQEALCGRDDVLCDDGNDAMTPVLDEMRAALAATEAPDDRSSPEDRERWLAKWHRKQREGGE